MSAQDELYDVMLGTGREQATGRRVPNKHQSSLHTDDQAAILRDGSVRHLHTGHDIRALGTTSGH